MIQALDAIFSRSHAPAWECRRTFKRGRCSHAGAWEQGITEIIKESDELVRILTSIVKSAQQGKNNDR